MKDQKVMHEPVLTREIVRYLLVKKNAHLKPKAVYIDATVGLGGHSKDIIKAGCYVLGIDADSQSLSIAEKVLKRACPAPFKLNKKGRCFKLVHGNFRDIDSIAADLQVSKVSGILLDLGVSSMQLTSRSRGFSFQKPSAKLDMRIDKDRQDVKASDLLNVLGQKQLKNLFEVVLGRHESAQIAKAIVEKRKMGKFEKVGDFLQIANQCRTKNKNLHPATLPFLALRIAVNSELENLKIALPKSLDLLKTGGRLAVISFHSGEDKLVKAFIRKAETSNKIRVVTKKPVTPSAKEITNNPRARSAKLRVIEKL
jgi:16S rRNA (cytosine1402-N4)-methyltransferase